ncbi:hypothetical protein BD779DRAFT_1540347 [Infundibulicybe gibba]|nr:hypothetical protein BD779DRAFT_1540347 [Infundibulicybe gibba]
MLRDAQTNVQTPSQSTVNTHTFDNLKNMMQIVKDAQENMTSEHSTSWFVGKFMYALGRDRFFNFYGQKAARHSYKWLIHGPNSGRPEPRTLIEHSYLFKILFKILSLLLFYAPDACLNAMEEVWAGGLTAQPHHNWTHFIGQLKSEWVEYITYSSILLNANVAFLAIPSSDAAGLLSLDHVCLAGIVIGWLLVRQHRTRHDYFFTRFSLGCQNRGLGELAILYGLPYALLMYGSRTWQQLKRSCQNLIGHTDSDGSDTTTLSASNSCFRMLWPWPRNTSTGLPMTREIID